MFILTGFLSTYSISSQERNVDISNCNYEFVYFSFQIYQAFALCITEVYCWANTHLRFLCPLGELVPLLLCSIHLYP